MLNSRATRAAVVPADLRAQSSNQYGVNALVGVWGNAYLRRQPRLPAASWPRQATRRAAMFKLVQPLNEHVAFTAEAGLNETLLNTSDSGRMVFGFQMGNYIHPKEYGKTKTPGPDGRSAHPLRTADAARRQHARQWPMPVRTRSASPPAR